MLSVVGRILFAQYWTSSAWVLLSLFPGWFLLGFCAGEESTETLENGMTNWITGIAMSFDIGLNCVWCVSDKLRLASDLSFFLFISFSLRLTVLYPTPGGPGVRATFVSFGTPAPWFELSQNAEGTTGLGFQWRVLWYSSANVVMLLGLQAY